MVTVDIEKLIQWHATRNAALKAEREAYKALMVRFWNELPRAEFRNAFAGSK